MNDNKNLQPDPAEEATLDQLLEQFLAEPEEKVIPDMPVETSEPIIQEAEPLPEECVQTAQAPAAEDVPAPTEEPIPEADMGLPETADAEIEAFEDTWIDEIMDVPMVTEEIGADENAVAAAGLVHPEEQAQAEQVEEPAVSAPVEAPVEQEPQPLYAEPVSDPVPPIPPIVTQAKEPMEMAKHTPARPAAEAASAEAPIRKPSKIRPRKKDRYGLFSLPHLAATVLWLAIIVFVGVGLGNIVWEYASDMLAFGREDTSIIITIYDDDDLDRVSEKLKSAGLIKYPSLFKIYANLADAMEKINPGTYTLNTLYDYNALVDSMASNASRVTAKVVIPEGYNARQIFQLLERQGVTTVAALEQAVKRVDPQKYWFLEDLDNTQENWLEGYLFPDTYTFYLNHNPDEVVARLLTNFDKRYTETMRRKLTVLNNTLSDMMRKNGLSEDYIAAHQMTLREVVIVASIIQKEAANPTEAYTIASVIYNRLTNPNAYPYLQSDATLVYITGHSVLTSADLALDSPYNTYKYPGLIPGAISNPSQASLAAALDPDATGYYFFVLNPDTGVHKFSETLAEHEAFLESLKQNKEE